MAASAAALARRLCAPRECRALGRSGWPRAPHDSNCGSSSSSRCAAMMSRTAGLRALRALLDARAHRGQRARRARRLPCRHRTRLRRTASSSRSKRCTGPTTKPRLAITPPDGLHQRTAAGRWRRGSRLRRQRGIEMPDDLRDLGDSGRGAGLEAGDHDFVAAAHAEGHQRHGALRIGARAHARGSRARRAGSWPARAISAAGRA